MKILAVDPGDKGVAVVLEDGNPIAAENLGWNQFRCIEDLVIEHRPDFAVVEGIRPMRGKRGGHKLLWSVGAVVNAFEDGGIEWGEVFPASWQKYAYGRMTGAKKSLAWVQSRGLPILIDSHDYGDAVIMGRYAWKKLKRDGKL